MTTDVGPVRERVQALLAAGLTRQQLAERTGLDRTTINRLLRRDVRRVHTDTAAALLAVADSSAS